MAQMVPELTLEEVIRSNEVGVAPHEYGSLRSARAAAAVAVDSLEKSDHLHRTRTNALRALLSSRIAALGSLFHVWDINGDGTVSREEFRDAMGALAAGTKDFEPPTDGACDEIFDEFDTDHSGQLSYDEFIKYALRDGLRRSSMRVMDFFRMADRDGSGTIDKAEFRHVIIDSMGYEMHDPYLIDELFDSIDTDGNGVLSFDEVYKQLRMGHGMERYLGSAHKPGKLGDLAATRGVLSRACRRAHQVARAAARTGRGWCADMGNPDAHHVQV